MLPTFTALHSVKTTTQRPYRAIKSYTSALRRGDLGYGGGHKYFSKSDATWQYRSKSKKRLFLTGSHVNTGRSISSSRKVSVLPALNSRSEPSLVMSPAALARPNPTGNGDSVGELK